MSPISSMSSQSRITDTEVAAYYGQILLQQIRDLSRENDILRAENLTRNIKRKHDHIEVLDAEVDELQRNLKKWKVKYEFMEDNKKKGAENSK